MTVTYKQKRNDTDQLTAQGKPLFLPGQAQQFVLASQAQPIVGEVVDANHPTLLGRVRVFWNDARGASEERWLACLQGLVVRAGDRVLVQHAANWAEPLVLGVVDGFARRPEAPAREAQTLQLRGDEKLLVRGEDDQPLLEVQRTAEGTRVRLFESDLNIELPGSLTLSAGQLELRATAGDVRISSSDDVKITGEVVRIN